MNLFRNLGIVGILIAATGCSMATMQKTVEKWGEVAQDTRHGLEVVNRNLDKIDAVVGGMSAKMEKMDTNKDGKLSLSEILAGLGLMAGGTGTIVARNAKSNARKTIIEKDIADLKHKLGGGS